MNTRPTPAGDAAAQLRHRALADASRRQLLATLLAKGPLGVRDLAGLLGLHENTVRAHVRLLLEAGLIAGEAGPAGARGRPRSVYRAVASMDADGAARDSEARYRQLAEILTAALAQQGGGAAGEGADIAAIAETWGRQLAGSDADTAVPAGDDEPALARLVALLEELGFAPQIVRDAAGTARHVAMRPCPYGELSTQHPEVICPVHLGLMRGALAASGAGVQVELLQPFVDGGSRCLAMLTQPDGVGQASIAEQQRAERRS